MITPEKVLDLMHDFLNEFGDDGYDKQDFIDYVVVAVFGDKLSPMGAPDLVRFYCEQTGRAAELAMQRAEKKGWPP